MIQLYDYKTSKICNYSPPSTDGMVNIIAYNYDNLDNFNICDLRLYLFVDTFKRILNYNKYKFFHTQIVKHDNISKNSYFTKFDITPPNLILNEGNQNISNFCDILIHNNLLIDYPIICDRKLCCKSIKNLGNYTLENLIKDYNFDYYDVKFYLLQYHYSMNIVFDINELEKARYRLKELREAIYFNKNVKTKLSMDDVVKLTYYSINFTADINDNLNIPHAIQLLFYLLNEMPYAEDVYDLVKRFDEVLGLNLCVL